MVESDHNILMYLQIRGAFHMIRFSFLHKSICCGYSLEEPWRDASIESHATTYAFVKK